MRKTRVFAALLITLLFVLEACVNQATNPTTPTQSQASKQVTLKQNFLAGTLYSPIAIELNIVQRWIGSGSKQLSFKSLNPPYAVNTAIRTQTSKVATSLEVRVYRKDDPYKVSDYPITPPRFGPMEVTFAGIEGFVITQKGDYVIDIVSVGCEWWVAIGHESENYRQ